MLPPIARCGLAVFLVSGIVALAGCKRNGPAIVPPKPPEVGYVYPAVQKVREYEDYTGATEAIPMVEVRARVTSELKKVLFRDGQDVEAGQDLFLLDDRQFVDERERAKATVAQTEATVLQKDLSLRRARELRAKGTNTPEELETAEAEYKVAKANRDLAIANLHLAELNVEYCHIKAPISGRISRKLIDEGNQITANTTPLTTIRRLDPMYAYFDVDERTLLRLRRLAQQGKFKSPRETRTLVDIGLADEETFSLQGLIDFSDNTLERTTGTLRVWIRIDNPDLEGLIGPALQPIRDLANGILGMHGQGFSNVRLLSPGMFVRIRFYLGPEREDLVVPEEALVSDQGIRHLFVLTPDDKVEYRPVQIGLLYGDMRVIKSGVTTADRVIVSGLQRVRDKIKVAATELKPEQRAARKKDI